MTFVLRMVWRETRGSWLRLGFFFLCVGLGVASIITLRSVVQHVRTALTSEARTLIAADVVFQSDRPYTAEVRQRLTELAATTDVHADTDVVNTQTMAAPVAGQGNGHVKLVELRAVMPAFPFYGRIELQNGRIFDHTLVAGDGAVVQPELLVALGLEAGDALRMAGRTFIIRGVLAKDRTQGNGGIAFGPRVYIDLETLRATSLLGFGSRASYQTLFKLAPDAPVAALTEAWRAELRDRFVGVRSWNTLEDRIGRNLTTAENYLSLVGFAIVVLGGLGVWSVTRVIVQQKMHSVAILKCIGASGARVLAIYLLQVLGLAASGSLLGLGLAALALAMLPAEILAPMGVTAVGPTRSAALQGVAVGLLVSLLFGLVPLLDIQKVKPLLLLRAHSASTRKRDWRGWVAGAALGLALLLIAAWQAGSWATGFAVAGGLGAITALLYGAGVVLVRLTRPLVRSRSFPIRHATLGLNRPGNQTRVILMAVGLGAFFIVGVRSTELSLLRELSTQVGEQSPDLVLIDIQGDQVDSLRAAVAPFLRGTARIAPLMRGRVAAVEGDRLNLPDVQAVRERRGLARQFGLTFRTGLESNEVLTAGSTWTSPWPAPETGSALMRGAASDIDTEVTVEEELFDESGLSIGDRIRFDVAGYSIRARIVGVRSVDWEDSQNGGFVFVLRPSPVVLQAPHSYVGFLQVRDDGGRRGALQRALVESHPNVSVIDVRDALAAVRDVVDNVTLGITIVGAVVLAGGILILIGAVAMTKFQRLYETAIYRALGASMRLVATTMAVEYGLLGTLAGLVGTLGGMVLSWGLARYLFDIEWRAPGSLLVTGVLGTGVVVTLVGILASTDVLLRKPLATLRSE